MARSLDRLPKAHLHLHFTGSLAPSSLADLARAHGLRLPGAFDPDRRPELTDVDTRGWFRFQRLYDAARSCVRGEQDMRRLVREAAAADAAEGSRWLELQVDPTSYAPFVGGISPALEIVLDEAAQVSASGSTQVAVVVAASRTRHPFDSRMLARLAARHAGSGPGTVVGFGLSNDEHRGVTDEFAPAFRIARDAGLVGVPHAGELRGPEAVRETLDALDPRRLGHGVRAGEDPRLLDELRERGVALEVCPGSNISLGVYDTAADLPLRTLYDAGLDIALGADDPLLFRTRLTDQYETARALGFTDAELAELARRSFRASTAPAAVQEKALRDIDAWLAAPA